jgi:hypothetical protein
MDFSRIVRQRRIVPTSGPGPPRNRPLRTGRPAAMRRRRAGRGERPMYVNDAGGPSCGKPHGRVGRGVGGDEPCGCHPPVCFGAWESVAKRPLVPRGASTCQAVASDAARKPRTSQCSTGATDTPTSTLGLRGRRLLQSILTTRLRNTTPETPAEAVCFGPDATRQPA